jgi:hypothetical protein
MWESLGLRHAPMVCWVKAGSFIHTISMWWLWVPKLARATPPRAAVAALGCFLLQLVAPLHQTACCWQAHLRAVASSTACERYAMVVSMCMRGSAPVLGLRSL